MADEPDKLACLVLETGERLTYRDLDEASNRFAHVLRDRGVRRGDHVALIVDNTPQFFEIVWAAYRCGCYFTPISTKLTPDEAAFIVNDCGAEVLVVASAVVDPVAAAQLAARTPTVDLRVVLGQPTNGWSGYDELTAAAPSSPIDDESTGRDMLYSSGTTGRPKGILMPLPETPIATTPIAITSLGTKLWGFDREMVYLSTAPLYHSAPLRFTMAVMQSGGTVIVMRHFDAEAALAAIDRYQVTHSQWVPTMFVRLLRLPAEVRERYHLSSLRAAIHAAAPCPVEVKRQVIERWGPVVYEYYSATEGHGLTALDSAEWLAHPGSVGRALIGVPHIVDENGAEVGPDTVGAIYFEGGNDFAYHNDPDKTAAARDAQGRGWATVGDVGYLDDDGYLYLTDRLSHMIISGGVNIYPQEVEDLLSLHPEVDDVAVIGVPDEDMGEAVKAVVQLRDRAAASADLAAELIDYCRSRLAHFKCPRSVDFVDLLPRQATGKMNKRELRARYATHVHV